MNITFILGIIRALLAAIGGYLASNGMIDQSTLDSATGASIVVATAVWSVIEKRKSIKQGAAK
jgi:flagellar motor component MotA